MKAAPWAAVLVPREQLIAEAAAERAQGREPEIALTREARPILSPHFRQPATNGG